MIAAPHMDDEVLGCGGLMAGLADKRRLHVIYATDGSRSPSPPLAGRDGVGPGLAMVRMVEAKCALATLGVPEQNAHFLGFPDGRLQQHPLALRRCLAGLLDQLEPDYLLVPFRFDRHADHLALNRAVTDLWLNGVHGTELLEYFIYYRWRLLPQADIRHYIDPRHLLQVDLDGLSSHKRRALGCFRSQTTRYFDWQARPNLLPHLLDEVSRTPERFVRYHPSFPGTTIFTGAVPWIRLVHRLEPRLKQEKDRLVALTRRGASCDGNDH